MNKALAVVTCRTGGIAQLAKGLLCEHVSLVPSPEPTFKQSGCAHACLKSQSWAVDKRGFLSPFPRQSTLIGEPKVPVRESVSKI